MIILWGAIALLCLFLWFSHRYAWWRPAVSYRCPRILMYHMVKKHLPGARFNGLRVSPERFECQLCWLRDHGWQSYTVSEMIDARNELPDKLVVLTFDDGFEDNYSTVFPMLKKYGFKATLYLVVDRHNRDWSVSKKAHHNNEELKNEPKLTDAQVVEMLDSGVFELGGHTLTHANLASLSNTDRQREIGQAKSELEDRFGVKVESFAYPFGIYSDGDPKLVAAAGYTSAVTTNDGIEAFAGADLFQLKRVKISGKDTMLAFALRMRGGRRGWNK